MLWIGIYSFNESELKFLGVTRDSPEFLLQYTFELVNLMLQSFRMDNDIQQTNISSGASPETLPSDIYSYHSAFYLR